MSDSTDFKKMIYYGFLPKKITHSHFNMFLNQNKNHVKITMTSNITSHTTIAIYHVRISQRKTREHLPHKT